MEKNINDKTNLNIDQDKIEAKYCDQILISHNPYGFTLDFAQIIAPLKITKILSRIAMSPLHAKAFSEALNENLKNYEKNYGKIQLSNKIKEETDSRKIGFEIN